MFFCFLTLVLNCCLFFLCSTLAALPPVKGVDMSIKSTVYVAQLAGLTGSNKVKFISVKEACASIYVPSLLTIN